MEETKRILLKLGKKVLLFLLSICIIYVILKPIIYTFFTRVDSSIWMNYEIEKQSTELLNKIPEYCINEGVGINLGQISPYILDEDEILIKQEALSYEIYNEGENIILYYEIKNLTQTDTSYNATITMSKDYKILKEKYSVKMEDLQDFDSYRKQVKTKDTIVIKYLIIFISIAIFMIIIVIKNMILDLRKIKD